MQVEEDPSSQFVDFTNATDSEQFVSDVEQALIAWKLSGKGHASLETLPRSPTKDPGTWTRELRFLPPGQSDPKTYTLSLFVASHPEIKLPTGDEAATARVSYKQKKWQEGLEHFTPTMLSVADGNRDFHWGMETQEETEKETFEAEGTYYTAVVPDEAAFSKKTVFQNVQKWFGVDEFLFLSRSSPHKNEQQPEQPSRRSNDVVSEVIVEDGGEEQEKSQAKESSTSTDADNELEEDEDAMADVQVDQNEAAFVPVFEPSRGTWIGSAVPGATGNVSISFDTDSVPELNPNQSCISGLLDFFKLKLQLPPHVEERCRVEADESGDLGIGMMVSASFGYTWNRADDPREAVSPENPLAWRTFKSQLPAREHHFVKQITAKLFDEKHSAPLVGSSTSPLEGMDLSVSWPKLREGTYVDNVVHSTLDPSSAPEWMLNVRFQDLHSDNHRKPNLPLSKQIANLVQVYSNSRELNKDILVSELAPPMPSASSPPKPQAVRTSASSNDSAEPAAPQSSSSIPESIPAARAAVVLGNAISSLVSAATWKGSDVEDIRRIVTDLFGDDDDDDKKDSGDTSLSTLATLPSPVQHGAPLGELVSILATRMGQLHGINSMSLLWVEFVKALRDRWFQQQLLPFMSTRTEDGGADHNTGSHSLDTMFLLDTDAMQLPPPDFRHCLLHQKLQLLNCCILRQAQMLKPSEPPKSTSPRGTDDYSGERESSQSDDEFFDSVEQQDTTPLPSPSRETKAAEGVLREIPGAVCVQTNEPLMEPVTQTAVPMTEDVAKQQQDLLTRLGVSVESDKLRQQIQSTSLISDMQSFKAANPSACLADFIRWYSPKDWIRFDSPVDPLQTRLPAEGRGVWWFEQHGMLSERMRFGKGHEHLWQQMWESSAPVPASRQKRLFDPLQESEKVYHYMETLSPHELFHQMLAGAISSSVFALETALPVRASWDTLPVVHRALQELRSRGNRAIALLDEALAESQVAFPAAGRSRREGGAGQEQQSLAAAHQNQQLQVAFEMALDACWRLVRALETVEVLVTKALALLYYFSTPSLEPSALALVNLLLLSTLSHRQQTEVSELLKQEQLRQQVASLALTNPTLAEAGPKTTPVQREYVLRCICPRPFLREYYGELNDEDELEAAAQPEQELEESPLVVCRMYAAFKKSTVRFALVLAESEF